jgi:hypothetical protein
MQAEDRFLVYSLTLKNEAVRLSETSVDLYPTTRCYYRKDLNLNSRRCENLNSSKQIIAIIVFLDIVHQPVFVYNVTFRRLDSVSVFR